MSTEPILYDIILSQWDTILQMGYISSPRVLNVMYTDCLQAHDTWSLVFKLCARTSQVRLDKTIQMPRGRGLKRKWADLPKWEGPLPKVLILGHDIPMHVKTFLDNVIQTSSLLAQINAGECSWPEAYARALGVSENIAEIQFEAMPRVSHDNIRERIEDLSAYRPDILVIQTGALDLGQTECDPIYLAKELTRATDQAFQEEIDLTVLLGDMRRSDEALEVTPEIYTERLKVFNSAIQAHCNKFFSYYFDKIPGFEGKGAKPMPVDRYSTNGFVPGPQLEAWGTKKLVKGFRFLLIELPTMLLENRSWTIRFQEVVDAGPRLTLGQFHFKYSCLTPITEEEDMDA